MLIKKQRGKNTTKGNERVNKRFIECGVWRLIMPTWKWILNGANDQKPTREEEEECKQEAFGYRPCFLSPTVYISAL